MPSSPENPEKVVITGRVDQVRFRKEQWVTATLKTDDGRTIPFVGSLLVDEGDRVEITGTWEEHPKYGRQLKVKSFRLDQTLSGQGLAQYLAVNPQIKGIGAAKAELLAKKFGADFAHSLKEQAAEMAKVAGVPLETITRLRDLWVAQADRNEMLVWLAGLGLTFSQISAIESKYGENSATVLRKNPYLLSREVHGFGFVKADAIAQAMGMAPDAEERVEAATEYVVRTVQQDGHTWVGFGELLGRVGKLTGLFDHREKIEAIVSQLVQQGRITGTWLTPETWALSTPRLLGMERELSLVLPMLGRAPNPHQDALSRARNVEETSLTPAQGSALLGASRNALLVITGGAGTGKTYTMTAIARRYLAAGLKVILGAPTGKAAQRMREMSEQNGGKLEAATLHRLLGYDGKRFRRGPDGERIVVDADVLLVDETSMIDCELCYELMQGLDLARTAVVFFGDHQQLASVGAGSVLRDMIERKLCPVFRLETVMRQAGVLKANSMKVLEGRVEGSSKASGMLEGEAVWPWLVVKKTNEDDVRAMIGQMFETELEGKLGLKVEDVQVLAPKYDGPAGVHSLNRMLQKIVQKKKFGVEVEDPGEGKKPKILAGDRVIQTRNNYDIGATGDGDGDRADSAVSAGVMNGTVGRVLEIRDKGKSMRVEMDGAEIEYRSEDVRDLELAYALTIHKSQGSEFPAVIAVIHRAHAFMLNRNLLYTAVTRARKVAIIVGDEKGILGAAGKTVMEKRRTMMGILPKENRA